ncbi:hypothetical protein DIPPA_26908 [Diplonema papillatum]|nr:hypothetical protein DIPPA_26908 [Diplonema papillatum]
MYKRGEVTADGLQYTAPEVAKQIAPYREYEKYLRSVCYVLGEAEVALEFVPKPAPAEGKSWGSDDPVWDGAEPADFAPWREELARFTDSTATVVGMEVTDKKKEVKALPSTTDLKDIVMPVIDKELMTDTEIEAAETKAKKEFEEKKKKVLDEMNTPQEAVEVTRSIWRASVQFKDQVEMQKFVTRVANEGDVELSGFMKTVESTEIAKEGFLVCRATGSIFPADGLAAHVDSPAYLRKVARPSGQWRTLRETATLAENFLYRKAFTQANADRPDTDVVPDVAGVARFVRLCVGGGDNCLRLVTAPPATIYKRASYVGEPTVDRPAEEVNEEIIRRVRDYFSLAPKAAGLSCVSTCFTHDALAPVRPRPLGGKGPRREPEPQQDKLSVVRIDPASAAVAEKLVFSFHNKSSHYITTRPLALTPADLWLDLLTAKVVGQGKPGYSSEIGIPAKASDITAMAASCHEVAKSFLDGALFADVKEYTFPNASDDPTDAPAAVPRTNNAAVEKAILVVSEPPPAQPELSVADKELARLRTDFATRSETEQQRATEYRKSLKTSPSTYLATLFRQAQSLKLGKIKVFEKVTTNTVEITVSIDGKEIAKETGSRREKQSILGEALRKSSMSYPSNAVTMADIVTGLDRANQMLSEVVERNMEVDEGRRATPVLDRKRPLASTTPSPQPSRGTVPVPSPRGRGPPAPAPAALAPRAAALAPRAAAAAHAALPVATPLEPPMKRPRPSPVAPAQPLGRVAPVTGGSLLGAAPVARGAGGTGGKPWNYQVEKSFKELLARELLTARKHTVEKISAAANEAALKQGAPREVIFTIEERIRDDSNPPEAILATWYLLDSLLKTSPAKAQFIAACKPNIEYMVANHLPFHRDPKLANLCQQLMLTWSDVFKDPAQYRRMLLSCGAA